MTWIDRAASTWGFDHVYVWLWNTTGQPAAEGAVIGPIQPLPDLGSRIVGRPNLVAVWCAPGIIVARGAIATLPDGTPLWFSTFEPVAACDGGDFTLHLPDWFWGEYHDLTHERMPDAHGNGGRAPE